MIKVENISKSYGEKNRKILAVDNIFGRRWRNFRVDRPDGSGKTSIFRMLTTLLHPDSGSAEIEGLDVVKDYKKSANSWLYAREIFSVSRFIVEENLEFFASVFNTTIVENLRFNQRYLSAD
ncbi:MAG: hypothetical protein U0T78_09590 [Cloacibacterium normanense]